MISSLTVSLGERSYSILPAPLDSPEAVKALQMLSPADFLIVADSHTSRFLPQTERLFQAAGKRCRSMVIPAGETSKNIANAMAICETASRFGLTRKSAFAALGGGVTGDLTGFAASLFLRGVPFIQIPTTLLAMVDSSVGGKTAVDTPTGKNLVGSFHQPSLVLLDTAFLNSLPAREIRCGMAEIAKYAMICDKVLGEEMRKEGGRPAPETLLRWILRSCAIKAEIVADDEKEEKESGRILLNYGHSFGHALEHLSRFSLSHGEAVALGMEMAAEIAVLLGLCSPETAAFQKTLTARCCDAGNIPFPPVTAEEMLEKMLRDKKNRNGKLRLIFPLEPGKLLPKEMTQEELLPLLRKYLASRRPPALPAGKPRISVSILGLGLLGTSLAMALDKTRYRVGAWCRNPETARWAKEKEIAETIFPSPEEALRHAEIAVLALPVEPTREFLQKYAPCCPEKCVVTDVASIQKEIMACAENLPLRFIGSHPMAGTEKSGAANAFATLYENADVFLLPSRRAEPEDIALLEDFWRSLHTHPRRIPPAEHDRLVASTSHALHVIASALAQEILDEPDLLRRRLHFFGCATGFRDTSRIASSSPEMWREICEKNRDEVVASLSAFQRRLSWMKNLLETDRFDEFENAFRKGRLLRDSWLCYKRADNLPQSIVLCGIKNAGKSVCGAEIAAILEKDFYDTDEILMRKFAETTGENKSVREIYRHLGEAEFRKREAEVVRSLMDGGKRVLSLGGGVVTNPYLTAQEIKKLGWIVFLDVDDEVAFERIKKAGLPPFLQNETDPFAAFVQSNRLRRKSFREIADFTLKRENQTVFESATEILASYNSRITRLERDETASRISWA